MMTTQHILSTQYQPKMSFKKRVFFRIFPTEKVDFNLIKLDVPNKKIYVRHLQELSNICVKSTPNYWEFETDGIFFNSDQEAVYYEVVDGVLTNVINGNNAVILAFGQVGCGKTFTISGLHLTEQELGILPRIAKDLLELKNREPKNIKITIQMSYVEFYNTCIVDLLSMQPKVIQAYKCGEVRKINILHEFDALKCIFIGEGHKSFVEENRKYFSNLYTTVATFHIIRKNMDITNPTKTCSRLHIIDMAGNDSCSHTMFKSPKQIGLANIMKSQLEQLILSLTENIPAKIKVKQRMNALTYYLNGDFSDQSILRFIGHIKVKNDDLVVTLSMLRFGNIIQGLKVKKTMIKFEVNDEVELNYLQNKLKSIEKEKHLDSVLLNQDLVSGMNQERIIHLNNLVQNYLDGTIQEITVMNVADTATVLRNIKGICHGFQNNIQKLKAENQAQTQQESQTSLKQRHSKSSSQNSGSKISRKSSKIRSKDGILKEKRLSGSVVSDKRIKSSGSGEITVADVLAVSQKRKKSTRSSSAINKQSLQSKRKSSNTSVERRDSKTSTETHMPIIEIIPEKQDMWRRFTTGTPYRERLAEYKQNEKDIKTNFISYTREIKKLKTYRDAIDKYNHDLFSAQTFRKFNGKDEYDDDGKLVLTAGEKECKEHLKEARKSLVEQQEKTLTTQEVLKVHVDNRLNITKQIEADFDQFCIENYGLPNGEIDSVRNEMTPYTFDVNLEYPEYVFDQPEEMTSIPDVSFNTQIIRNFQKLMLHEQKKMKKRLNKKKNEWKMYIKQ